MLLAQFKQLMPQFKKESLPKQVVKFTITVPLDEMKPFLEEAVEKISQESTIPGFRPGKATYDVVKRRVGEMKIYEAALEPIVRKTFLEAIMSEKLETVGTPSVNIEKLAPGNDLVYTAEVSLMPKILKLADWRSLSVKAKKVETTDAELERALKDLQRMQTKEVRAKGDEATTKADKVVVDVQMKKDNVPIEGGQGLNHGVYLNEDYYIPGFADQIIGMKETEKRSFDLEFPKEHFQKHLAGAKINFEVTLKELYHLDHPELDDAFAASLGQKDMATIRGMIKDNILHEKEHEEAGRQEREMLELVSDKTQYEDIPDLLVNEELEKMIHELQHGVEERGLEFDAYLNQIKKTLGDLKLDMAPQAMKRVKVALAINEIAKTEKVGVEEKDLDAELDRAAAEYKDNEDVKKQIYSPPYRDYLRVMMRNRKVVDLLRKAIIKS